MYQLGYDTISSSSLSSEPPAVVPARVTRTQSQQRKVRARSAGAPPLTLAAPTLPARPYKPRPRKEPRLNNKWFQLSERPYRTAAEREAIADGAKYPVRAPYGVASQPAVYHVDFTTDEVAQLVGCITQYEGDAIPDSLEALARLCQRYNVPTLAEGRLKGRSTEDIRNFCSDLLAGKVSPPENLQVLSLSQDVHNQSSEIARESRIPSLLLARELESNLGFGRMRRYENFQNEFRKAREDGLQVVAEFTNCAGDITAGSWVSPTNFLCGTTAHSDTHNQQYNKPGNLLLCSTTAGTLRAFPDHRIPRPVVEKGENSTEAMRQSQDPWLYSSVVSSDYDTVHDLAYTSGFDKTVKVWKVNPQGSAMEAMATWYHAGNVNFVAAAKDGSGRVATAADSSTEAIRIYTVDLDNPSESPFVAFSCSRTDADNTDKWSYFPATMQWGRAVGTHNLLLVGYSPRSTSGDDSDIPEDRRKSGEITLWDANEGCRLPVLTASTANVFEVVWHPTLPRFIVGTSPIGLSVEHGVRTQVHIFQRDKERIDGAYTQFQTLDCFASDINELTFVPNSVRYAYVTAACTDGNVYVWDTAQGDKPVYILKHGRPLEECHGDREREDTGVKMTVWGSSPDRFYTGSSDGVVKAWNIRKKSRPLVRKLLEAPGPISFGAFSPDYSKLAIGDATGRVFMLSVDKRDEPESHNMTLPGTTRRIRRPMPLIPHPEPPPPSTEGDSDSDLTDDDFDVDIATYSRRMYLDSRELVLTSNPVIGAVQGPRYEHSGLFRKDAHLDNNPLLPLLASFERNQQESTVSSRGMRRRSLRRIRNPGAPDPVLEAVHEENRAKDLDLEKIESHDMEELVRAGALLNISEDWGFNYEEMPGDLLEEE